MVLTDDQRALVVEAQRLPTLIAYEFTTDPHRVADLVGVGHLALCVAATTWDAKRAPWMAYARMAARRDMINYLQGYARREGREEASGIAWCFVHSTPTGPDMDSGIEARRLLDLLEGVYQEVFALHVLGGMAFKAIGSRYGRSSVWAWKVYRLALASVQESLKNPQESLLPQEVEK